jgi:RND family efflux transporter MFP subunit
MKRILSFCTLIVFSAVTYIVSASEPAQKEEIKFEGTLQPVKEAVIRSRISSKVIKLHVQEGDSVKKGQNLIELDGEETERALGLAQVAYERRKIEREKAIAELDKVKILKDKNAASDDELNNAERGLRITELALKEAEVALEKAQKDSESILLRAPINGTAASISKKNGDIVSEDDELVRMVDSQALSLVAVLDSVYYGKIKSGMEIIFTTDYLKESFKTRIEKVVPFSEKGKEFKISAAVSNANLRLLPGTKAKCIIKLP